MANQAEFKAFEKSYNAIRRANTLDREDAVGLLTPKLIREHLASGKDLVLPYGRSGASIKYTAKDLKAFDEALSKTKVANKPGMSGMPLLMLEKASSAADKARSSRDIRSALLYKVRGNVLHFQVSASPGSKKQHYQVRIRLDEWFDQLTNAQTWLSGARHAAMGRISFDCACGRHQFWFRYLATVSGCALTPKEKDFPKIRNPQLKGFCCKHVLKVLKQLRSAGVHALLAKEMELQAEAPGYADAGKTKFLTKKDLAKMKRVRGSEKESPEAKKAYEDFTRAKTAYRKKTRKKSVEKQLQQTKAELKARNAEKKAYKARASKAEATIERQALALKLSKAFMMGEFVQKISRDEVRKTFSAENGIDIENIKSIEEEFKV